MIQLETAKTLAQRYLGPTVVVLLVLLGSVAGGTAWVWNQNEKVIERGKQLAVEQQAFNKEKLASEIALSERKAELDKREFIVQQREKDYQEQLANLQKREAEHSEASAKLKQEQAAVSKAQIDKAARVDIERRMTEFSAYGVNLRHRPPCDNGDAQARYNAAEAKYWEIATLANAYGLKDPYKTFLNSNATMVVNLCPQTRKPWLITPTNMNLTTDTNKVQQ